jgi:prevent-host-death family protein
MRKIPEIVPITDFRHDAAGVLKRAQSSKEPLIITQRGRASAVLLSVDAYEKTEHDLEILRLLALGEKEIAAGKGCDLDVILAEADELLAEGTE